VQLETWVWCNILPVIYKICCARLSWHWCYGNNMATILF